MGTLVFFFTAGKGGLEWLDKPNVRDCSGFRNGIVTALRKEARKFASDFRERKFVTDDALR
jgi:hypothetical protein